VGTLLALEHFNMAFDDLPRLGGYQQMIDPVCAQSWPGCCGLEWRYFSFGGSSDVGACAVILSFNN
jgi:hypothetical protein